MLDIEQLLREGKTYNDIERMVTAQMHAAQKKIDKEKEAEAAAKQFEEKRKIARERVVAALKEYLPLVVENVKEEDVDNAVTAVVKGLEITKGAQKYSDWDVIDLMALVNTIFE